MNDTYRDEFIELNGCRHHYQDWGDPGAPPLVMVHGLTQHSHSFDSAARALSTRYRCLSLDVRGRGQSGWSSPESYAFPLLAADVTAFMDALGFETVNYLGTSMGGLIAMTIAVQQPRRLLSLALNDIGPHLGLAGLKRIRDYVAERPERFASLEEYLELGVFPAFPWLRERPREPLLQAAQWAVLPDEQGGFRLRYDPQATATPGDPKQRKAFEQLLWQGFGNLKCPLLVIRGQESELLETATVGEMGARQPGMQLAEIPGVGHAPSLDEPEAMAALEDFFSSR